jgi:hypothetical protein
MIQVLVRTLKRFASRVKQHLKQWSKPAIASIAMGTLSDLRRSRKDLIIENTILRQQLIVLNRQVKRPVRCKNIIQRIFQHQMMFLHLTGYSCSSSANATACFRVMA